eukprot:962618_1
MAELKSKSSKVDIETLFGIDQEYISDEHTEPSEDESIQADMAVHIESEFNPKIIDHSQSSRVVIDLVDDSDDNSITEDTLSPPATVDLTASTSSHSPEGSEPNQKIDEKKKKKKKRKKKKKSKKRAREANDVEDNMVT